MSIYSKSSFSSIQSEQLQKKPTVRKTREIEPVPIDQDIEKIYQKIVELLIAAGYFRARIQNLDPFDKILGGIVWTLTGSFCDVDIEFKDDMSLAEKLKTSEKIVLSLKAVNCPITINPHQIQGLDYPVIYQILQWLVKKLLESRDQRHLQNKQLGFQYFESNFEKKFSKKDVLLETTNNNLKKQFFTETKYNFTKVGRKFRNTSKLNIPLNDPLKVYFTLIEYGMNKDISFQRTIIDLLKKKNFINNFETKDSKTRSSTVSSTSQQQDAKNNEKISNEDQKLLDEIINTNIKEISNEKLKKLNTNIIEEIFSENIDSIVEEITKFENLQGNESIDKIKLFLKEKERLENTKISIQNQIQLLEKENNIIEDSIKAVELENDGLLAEIDKIDKNNNESEENLKKLNKKISLSKISPDKMEYVIAQVKRREELKSLISQLKKECVEEKKQYELQIENLEKKHKKLSDKENSELFNEIDRNYQQEYEKLLLKKKDLFEQNKIINLLTRKIQIYPSKLELIQYQKRFQELYDQINKISDKSKSLLSEINCREELKKLLHQKLDIIVQLKSSYRDCKTKKDKDNFKESLNNVIESLTESLTKTSDRLKTNMKLIEEGQTKLNQMLVLENNYMKLIKEYNKEYNKQNK